jgi:hypothetical protein
MLRRLVRRRVVGNLVARLELLEKALTVEAGGYRWVVHRQGASEYAGSAPSPRQRLPTCPIYTRRTLLTSPRILVPDA